ncbi:uncharacterized protein PAC_18833 [Phialocephala subalpina]|uniref:Uncharacterized protein n=1 Tax=Phialocephala subalpina TaxID=576137 RepID=A0A1L7XV53_9HELO|nr:uncharacterized protein PAC_18833 [Phialocephala subalpina]
MTTTPSVIQILSRNNYEDQHLVSLPNALPFPALAPSSIRIKTSIFSLTANNLMYGRIGHIIRTWEIHPLPSSIPSEYSDPTKFGRIGAWGYATVQESNVPDIEVDSQIFGLLPIGTLPLDMKVQLNQGLPGQFSEVSKHRENVMPLYNQYLFYPPVSGRTSDMKESRGYDALFQIFFTTSYLINRFAFPWVPAEFLHPSNIEDNWTPEKGEIDQKTTVLVFADSGKTALALGYLLKSCRPEGSKPKSVIGIGSQASRDFAKGTRFYDKTLMYEDDSGDLDEELGLAADSKIVVVEFGSRGGAAARWANKLRESHDNVVQLIVAGEVVKETPEEALEKFKARTKTGATVFNASAAGVQAVNVLGEKRYSDELLTEWLAFKNRGLVQGLELVWGVGMEAVGKGWEKLCKGEVKSDQGLVFYLE